jgi:hypothetical protein
MQSIRPVGPGVNDFPSLLPMLSEVRAAVKALQVPGNPVPLPQVAFASLPPAADWTGHQVWVSDKNKVGVSNGTSWTDPAGGAL